MVSVWVFPLIIIIIIKLEAQSGAEKNHKDDLRSRKDTFYAEIYRVQVGWL